MYGRHRRLSDEVWSDLIWQLGRWQREVGTSWLTQDSYLRDTCHMSHAAVTYRYVQVVPA